MFDRLLRSSSSSVENSVLTFLDLLQTFFKIFLTMDTDRPNSFIYIQLNNLGIYGELGIPLSIGQPFLSYWKTTFGKKLYFLR